MKQTFKNMFEEIDWFARIEAHHVQFVHSYLVACDAARQGDLYCWLCASYNMQKNGIRVYANKVSCSFHCLDCQSDMSYPINREQYNNLNFRKSRKGLKNKYKQRRH